MASVNEFATTLALLGFMENKFSVQTLARRFERGDLTVYVYPTGKTEYIIYRVGLAGCECRGEDIRSMTRDLERLHAKHG